MKRAMIVVLVCVNVALLGALMFGRETPKANAQVFGGASNYIVVTANIGKNDEAVFVVDVAKQKMMAWRFDENKEKFSRYRAREFKKDFRVKNR